MINIPIGNTHVAEQTQNKGFFWRRIRAGVALESRYLAAVVDIVTESNFCYTLALCLEQFTQEAKHSVSSARYLCTHPLLLLRSWNRSSWKTSENIRKTGR